MARGKQYANEGHGGGTFRQNYGGASSQYSTSEDFDKDALEDGWEEEATATATATATGGGTKSSTKPKKERTNSLNNIAKRLCKARATGELPHEFLLRISRGDKIVLGEDMNGEELFVVPDLQLRVYAAKEAAPYYAPKLAQIEAKIDTQLNHVISAKPLSTDEWFRQLEQEAVAPLVPMAAKAKELAIETVKDVKEPLEKEEKVGGAIVNGEF